MHEPKVARSVVLDGDSVEIDGAEFPWMVTPDIAVETILDNPQPGEAPLHTVTLTLYADSVEVRNLPPRTNVTYSRTLSQYSERFSTNPPPPQG